MIVSTDEAIDLLNAGVCVGVPTETVYGLAASASDDVAIAQIFRLKNRPQDNPLIVHVSSLTQLDSIVQSLSDMHKKLIELFWPGPLTLIFDAQQALSSLITGGQKTVAVRMPDHPLLLEILEKTGPLVAPSANVSGRPSPTNVSHVEHDFGIDFPVVNGGACKRGLESTIVSLQNGVCTILRKGSIIPEQLAAAFPIGNEKIDCCVPGAKYKHYAPQTPLYPLSKNSAECVIGFRDRFYRTKHLFSLGHSENPQEIAKNLFGVLRAIDYCGFDSVNVDLDFPKTGLYTTIHERLARALARTSHKHGEDGRTDANQPTLDL